MNKTEQDFINKIISKKITRWDIHNCSICGYTCGYIFENSKVYYDNGCFCISCQNIREASFSEILNHYNQQTNQQYINEMNKFWGFENKFIPNQNQYFMGCWSHGNLNIIANDFAVPLSIFDNINILLAIYNYENYSAEAFVLFEKNNILYEVNANHCSCCGLEGQWEPEQTTVEALLHRMNKGGLGYMGWYEKPVFVDELYDVLCQIKENHGE